ncbi:eukaryotic translation initiation factor 5B [Balamuthia mandrillaris]
MAMDAEHAEVPASELEDEFEQMERERKNKKKNQQNKQSQEDGTEEGGGGVKILSKKQKEKLKKQQQKEQAKQKAQQRKQAGGGGGGGGGKKQESSADGADGENGTALGGSGGGTALGGGRGGTALGGGASGTALGGGGGGTALGGGGGTALGGGAAAKKKNRRKQNKKKGGAGQEDEEETESPAPAAVEPAGEKQEAESKQEATATPDAAVPAAETAATEDGEDEAQQAEGGAAAKKKNKKKKKKPAAKEAEKAVPRKGISKAMAQKILKMKEEEERLRQEAEQRAREEEERLRLEEERRQKELEELQEKRRLAKIKKKERQAQAAVLEKQKKREQALARLGMNVQAPPGLAGERPASPENVPKKKKQSQMYARKKKNTNNVAPGSPAPEAEEQVVKPPELAETAEKVEEQPQDQQKEEDLDWEAKDVAAEFKAATGEEEEEAEEKDKEAAEKAKQEEQARQEQKQAEEQEKEAEQLEKELANVKSSDMRSPICCILGHVDTGKTKLLDKIRRTNVQGGEAGGITQQIGATYFPLETLEEKTHKLTEKFKFKIKVPGLLIIDTPGHESFTNLRSRGSSLCDIAILVVDLMHGLEQQTLESIQLLKMKKTPFIVALNKMDVIFGWKPTPDAPFEETYAKQSRDTKQQFDSLVRRTITNFAEQGLNACLYFQNKDFGRNVSLVPTSAITGEGIPDLLALLIQLTQKKLSRKIAVLSTFQATVLEVKMVTGLGMTIDVILVNGTLHEGDKIVVCGLDGPIVTNIRALLTPHPLKEIRVKTPYIHHKELQAAQGVKISAPGLERAVAGSSLLVVGPDDDIEELKERVQGDLTDMLKKVKKVGVCVQASTLGSLEALLTFLESSKIPVSVINIGPVHRADVIRASVNLEKGKRKEYGTILAFDVPVNRDAREEAERVGVRIFTAEIIYHLFDQFTAYLEQIKEEEKREAMAKVVFPCVLEIMPDCIFHQKYPIVIGVRVKEGVLKIGTPLCIQRVNEDDPKKKITRFIGKVTSLQDNHKDVEQAVVDMTVAIKIEGAPQILYGRHLDHTDLLYSQITRESIDVMKEYFRAELQNKELIKLIQKLKKMFGIM